MKNENKLKTQYLLKNTKLFAIGNLSTKFISFFLVPLYTYCLSTYEYGIIDLLFTISSMLVPVFTLNISESVYRFSLDENNNDNKINCISLLIVFFCIIFSLITIPCMYVFPKYSNYVIYFYLLLNSLSIFTIFSANLKGKEKILQYNIGNIINSVCIILLNVILLKIFNMGIKGYFLSFIISYIVGSIYCFAVSGFKFNNACLDKQLLKEMLKYSIILIPNTFLWWVIDSSDRIMINYFNGAKINGLYAIAYKIPALLYAVTGIFNQAWVFSAIKEKDSTNNSEYANKVFKTLLNLIGLISITILVFIKPFFKIYLSPNYFSAWKYVPFLLIGSMVLTLSNFISASYNTFKDGKGIIKSSFFGAIINIMLNFIFIPFIGPIGAAFATCLSYILVFIYRLFDTQKYLKIELKKSYFIPLIILIIISIILYLNIKYSSIVLIIIYIFTLFLYRSTIINLYKAIKTYMIVKKDNK